MQEGGRRIRIALGGLGVREGVVKGCEKRWGRKRVICLRGGSAGVDGGRSLIIQVCLLRYWEIRTRL